MASSTKLISLLFIFALASAKFLPTPSVPKSVNIENHEGIFSFVEGFFQGMSVQLDKPEVEKCFEFSIDARESLKQAIQLYKAHDIHWLKYFGLFIAYIPDVEEFCYQTLQDAQVLEELVKSFSSVNQFVAQVGFNALANAFNLYWIATEGKEALNNNDSEGVGFAVGRAFSALLLQNQTNFLNK